MDKPRGRPPWTVADKTGHLEIRDADNRPLFQINYWDRVKPQPNPLDLMSKDEASKIARAMLKMPRLLKAERERQ